MHKNWACLVIVLLFVVESAGSCLMREGVKGEEFVGLELSELESRHEVSTRRSLVELTELLLFCISEKYINNGYHKSRDNIKFLDLLELEINDVRQLGVGEFEGWEGFHVTAKKTQILNLMGKF